MAVRVFSSPYLSQLFPTMSDNDCIVFIVEDDDSVRDAIANLLESVHIRSEVFASTEEFLGRLLPAEPCCLVLDVRLPGRSGLDFQEHLAKLGISIPIIFITAHGDVPMTARAMKAGAVEFLAKPFQKKALLDAIDDALKRDRLRKVRNAELQDLIARYEVLTLRQREVMKFVCEGTLNKQIAAELGLSEVTVKMHRRQVMERMKASTLPDLVRMWDKLQVELPK